LARSTIVLAHAKLPIAHDPPGIRWPERLFSANGPFCTESLPYPESFFGKGKEESLAETAPAREQDLVRPPTPQTVSEAVQARIDEKLSAFDRKLAAQQSIDDKLANLDKRLEEQAKARQEKELSQKQEIKISPRDRGRGFGIGR